MKWTRFGISLIRIREEHLELVRQQRNDPEIRKYMEFQDEITPEMQMKWFKSIDNIENYYYIIEFDGRNIGLIHNKNVDWQTKNSESGIFIWDRNSLSTHAALFASLCFCEIGFYIFQGGDSVIKVRKDNHRAIEYNRLIGFELYDENFSDEFNLYMLTKENFERKSMQYRKLALGMSNNDHNLYLEFDDADMKNGIVNLFIKYYNVIPLQITILKEGRSYAFEIPL
jgi:UDP-4-amino-4,6-dideoxy-N-acetyl-beta-L-altrosamine N-acetyltransferase